MVSRRLARGLLWGGAVVLSGISGCSPEWYRESADTEARAIISDGHKEVLGYETSFEVEQQPLSITAVGYPGQTEDLKETPPPEPVLSSALFEGDSPEVVPQVPQPPVGEEPKSGEPESEEPESGGAAGDPQPEPRAEPPPEGPEPEAGSQETETAPEDDSRSETDSVRVAVEERAAETPQLIVQVLDLESALWLAFSNNRQYQTDRESVYLTALSLSLARHDFAPRFFGIITGDWSKDAEGNETGSINSNFGMNLLLFNGARLSINVLNNLFQFFTGDRREVAQTIVEGTLTQPLLRGFGRDIVREPLTQAERNVLYEVRSLERARKSLAVAVITEYYRVLQARDRVDNEYANWQSLVSNRARVEALADAERVPRFQVDQARQQEFAAQNSWVDAVENYESQLDGFKLTLGIPTDSDITLDQAELELLRAEPIASLAVPVGLAVRTALEDRLDLHTSRDQVADAERRIKVARDGLRAQLDVGASAALQSGDRTEDAQKPFTFNTSNFEYGFGFDLDLPLDRKAERNAYVQALISFERSKRNLSESEDNIRLSVREAYRRLEREIISYKIQRDSVELAEQRVDSTTALLQAGRAETRDVLDSQNALLSARNQLTAALINYALARLEFQRATEALRVDDRGRIWAEEIGAEPENDIGT